MIRRDWGGVKLREYDAILVLSLPDPEAAMNAWWDETHKRDLCAGPDPDRLSHAGRARLDRLVDMVRSREDEQHVQDAATEFVSAFGVLLTTGIARLIREAA